MLGALIVIGLLQAAPPLSADQQLIAAARTASAPYQDRNAAIRAGYRKLGPEIPEMGEHWINPIMIVESRYDPKRPAMLTYATINGKPTLTGVAYALAMRPGEAPPPSGVSGDWHDHSASVNDELASGDHTRAAGGSRVVVLHAWVWVDNPAGVFADENWALPYLRLGLQPPAEIDTHAARAIALRHDGVAYYANVLRNLTGEDFTAELNAAASLAATAHAVDLPPIWRDMINRMTIRVTRPGLREGLQRALGLKPHEH